MKTTFTLFITLLAFISLASRNAVAQTEYSVSMGNQYANEVFFSLTDGVVKVSPRNSWDIAFYTNAFSAGIITNDGSGVELYTYPNAAADGWAAFDTIGMTSWKKLYNTTTSWEEGAFNRNATGHPDYGWGVYSMTSHDVIGDSLYLIKPVDGIYRKLHIVRKISTENKFIIRYANLDGSNDVTDTLSVNPYNDRILMAFSFNTGIVDRDPVASSWDIVFTRYMAMVQNTPYPVNGVKHKAGNTVAQADNVAPDFTDYSSLEFLADIDVIGHDWKTINMTTFQWEIEDSLAYFVQTEAGSVYKVVFDAFSGSGTGTTTLNVRTLATASASFNQIEGVKIYPNPATDFVKIELDSPLNGAAVVLMDLSGRIISKQKLDRSLMHEFHFPEVTKGTYLLRLTESKNTSTYKVVIF
ncbi:MAG: T9SS type A sorting domain-containing protein [Lentimicrobium sp.]|nr:T9SS type A sorting domain-containing protein [Lentimicrobium sp.]